MEGHDLDINDPCGSLTTQHIQFILKNDLTNINVTPILSRQDFVSRRLTILLPIHVASHMNLLFQLHSAGTGKDARDMRLSGVYFTITQHLCIVLELFVTVILVPPAERHYRT